MMERIILQKIFINFHLNSWEKFVKKIETLILDTLKIEKRKRLFSLLFFIIYYIYIFFPLFSKLIFMMLYLILKFCN